MTKDVRGEIDRLRRVLVDSFMAEDTETWVKATSDIRALLVGNATVRYSCVACGAVFVPKRKSNRFYCSPGCKKKRDDGQRARTRMANRRRYLKMKAQAMNDELHQFFYDQTGAAATATEIDILAADEGRKRVVRIKGTFNQGGPPRHFSYHSMEVDPENVKTAIAYIAKQLLTDHGH